MKAGSKPYQHASPPRLQNILEFDCRGLEFTEFKPDVSAQRDSSYTVSLNHERRVTGSRPAWSQGRSSPVLTWKMEIGLTMMKRLERK